MDIQNDATFVAPEGVYSLTEDLKSTTFSSTGSTQPSHTIPYPARVSTITLNYLPQKQQPAVFANLLGGGTRPKDKELKDKDEKRSVSSSDRTEDDANTNSTSPDISSEDKTTPATPIHPPNAGVLSSPTVVAVSLSRSKSVSRPKHNIRTTSSSFVTRVNSQEGLSKYLATKQGLATYIFHSAAHTFFWSEQGGKFKEALARITFSAFPTAHSVNQTTASTDRLDIIIGFNTGDLVWYDPISSRYLRLNKAGAVSTSAITAVKWVPRRDRLFVTAHQDGTILIFDRDWEDPSPAAFVPRKVTISNSVASISTLASQSPASDGHLMSSTTISHTNGAISGGENWNQYAEIIASTPSWHSTHLHAAATPGIEKDYSSGFPPTSPREESRKKSAKNPLGHWRVSHKAILDFVYSPDVHYIACISEDGGLRIIDALDEKLVDCYASYFGAFTCVEWSPDGRFILTGGQDDTVTIYSPWDQRVIARCQGHASFVTSVSFDDARSDYDFGRTYRFASVGEDCRLILWDFSPTALHRPKLHAHTASQQQNLLRNGLASTVSLAMRRRAPDGANPSAMNLTLSSEQEEVLMKYHPAPPRGEVAVLQPVLVKYIEADVLSHVSYLPNAILTCSRGGHIKLWVRPLSRQQATTARRRVGGTP